ncbi:hypothetical protein GCM10010218_13220 [Streptomyces mashuensis]|uniref:NadR/Ttd14 AAA domain-containing protein n=1 Tax=Streptomyces mashuensis TaxID=33904 RepID=A0A919EBZ5_9ACTN|nr:AAA family ATPase [Streptomyces mashuensis]GHF33477.1 hypothetical protein GCM10010218_13220 [Streptomyces mashuensis]
MPIRDCAVLAVEGTQAAGKTTFVHALTAHYREQGVNVACTGEPARTSPFMEAIVLHGQGTFDLAAELDLFALQLTTTLRAARNHRLLITDKTPANVLALARLVLDPADPGTAAVLDAMESMCRAWMPQAYDLVIYCRDRFDQQAGGDRFRTKVLGLQDDADHAVLAACQDSGVRLAELPTGLDTAGRVRWTAEQVERRGLAA